MNGREKSAKTGAIAGIVAGVFNFNPLAIILAVVAVVNFNKPESVEYEQIG